MQSFYAPYLCESCGTQFQAVIDAHLHRDAVRTRTPPAVVCPSCGSDGQFAGVPAAFAASAEQLERATTLVADGIGKTPGGSDAIPANLKRHVEGGATHVVLQGELSSSVRWRSGMDGIEGALVLDLTRVTGVGAGGIAPLVTALRAPVPEITTVAVKGSPLALAQTLRGAPIENVTVLSVAVEGHCPKCKQQRRAMVPVEDGRWELNLARGARCPIDNTKLEMNRTLQDLPQRRMPIRTLVAGSGMLAGLGVVVVLVAAFLAASGPGPGDGADAFEPFTIDDQHVTIHGRGGPLGTEAEARTAARTNAMGELISALNREIGARRGVSAGGLEVGQPEVDAFLADLGADAPQEVDSASREVDGGFTVEATYGLPRSAFDAVATRFAEEKSWGGLTLIRPFPPAGGLLVVKSAIQGVEPGMRVVQVSGAPVTALDQLPVNGAGVRFGTVDRNGSAQEFIAR